MLMEGYPVSMDPIVRTRDETLKRHKMRADYFGLLRDIDIRVQDNWPQRLAFIFPFSVT